MANKVEADSGKIVEIYGSIIREGVEKKYEFSLIKCNQGGYIAVRGEDVGAYVNIEEALGFLNKDIRAFMQEPPMVPKMPYDQVLKVGTVPNYERGWTFTESLGVVVLTILAIALSFLGFSRWWPDLL